MSETIKLSYVSVRDYEGKENVKSILLWKIEDLVCYSKGENAFYSGRGVKHEKGSIVNC